jgi:predicted RecB family nuclease
MVITEDIFGAFLQCETKSYLTLAGAVGDRRQLTDWERQLTEDYQQQFFTRLRSHCRDSELLRGVTLAQALAQHQCRFALDCVVQTRELQSHIPMLERVPPAGKTSHLAYIPVRLLPREKLTRQDKLLVAFDALVLATAAGTVPHFGKIIHGSEYAVAKVKLEELLKTARAAVGKITAQQAGCIPPLMLNKHCAECEFQARCHQIAVEKDELSLLSGLTAKEWQRQHNKGIFSVTQLSYTFRARRKPKRLAAQPEKYSHALRALAIREQKIHVAGNPALNLRGTPVYLDVEGVPDRDFYYLIGLRITSEDASRHHSFWANDKSEEKEIWAACLRMLTTIEKPQLIHYGSYETLFLKRLKERYSRMVAIPTFLDQLIAEAVNLLSVIYAQIYFPTYSNGLKDIARHLGFHWSAGDAAGLHTLMWRSAWEASKDPSLKQKLLTYNAEDCEALERVTSAITQLCQWPDEATQRADNPIIYTDSLPCLSPFRLGKNSFVLPELAYINEAAYWNYQRDKIYIRSSPRLRRIARRTSSTRAKVPCVNKVVECDFPPLAYCPKCKDNKLAKYGKRSKIVHDLRFDKAGVRRWTVKYVFQNYFCRRCGTTYYSQQRPWTRSIFGSNLRSYTVYQIIELRLSQQALAHSLRQLTNFPIDKSTVSTQKARAAQFYQSTYEGILKKIISGKLIQADETRINIKGRDAYVWIFTNLEEVVYYYTETREGDFLQELLRGFTGVLVSDFYTAYDALTCPQQKCLIHLMRDLNDDLLKQPFNEEVKELVREFASLLKPMVETIDRFGLKAHFLRKHQAFVDRFYKTLSKRDYQSEVAIHYRKRFEKNRGKLFTFLDYDAIPWNNNNAEHAIKAFAALRKNIDGMSTEKSLREYLVLLSICGTCKYKGVSFLDFLRSGEKDIDDFFGGHPGRRKGSLPGSHRQTESTQTLVFE